LIKNFLRARYEAKRLEWEMASKREDKVSSKSVRRWKLKAESVSIKVLDKDLIMGKKNWMGRKEINGTCFEPGDEEGGRKTGEIKISS
jgi:hypothetical protein